MIAFSMGLDTPDICQSPVWDHHTPSRPMFRKLVDVDEMDRTPLLFIIGINLMYLKQVVLHPT